MKSKGLFVGRTASCALQVTIHALPVWSPECTVGPQGVSSTDRTASLSSGSLEPEPTSTRGSGPRLELSDLGLLPLQDLNPVVDAIKGPDGLVVGMVVLGATFMAGGLAGFLLALLCF